MEADTEGLWSVTSPNSDLELVVMASNERVEPLSFLVLRQGSTVIGPSPIGLVIGQDDFSEARIAAASPVSALDHPYELIHGKRLRNRSISNERVLLLEAAGGALCRLVLRALDDAVAFRFEVLGEDERRLGPEATAFEIGQGSAWIQPHDAAGFVTPAYEAAYTNGSPIGAKPDGPSWNMPALFEIDSAWILLAESDLRPNTFGSHLEVAGDGYRLCAPEPDEGNGFGEVWPMVQEGWQTPWRVIVVGDLSTIVETSVVTDLASPSRIEDPSWITPGRAAWHWWSDHGSTADLARLEQFIDFAGSMGWEHNLIDANWDAHSDIEIRRLVDRAADQGVKTWLWYNSGGPNNAVTEAPRDRMFDGAVRRSELAKLSDWGVGGVKVDFFHSDKPAIVDLMWGILEDAAKVGIMVVFHGCSVPRGWSRTWPHLMTQEGVRGAEQYGFASTWPETAVWHNTILPFTRNVVGSMDYTPVSLTPQLYPRLTSTMHELALAIVYESGIQHFAESPEGFRALPEPLLSALADMPAAWDETRLVAGRPGTHAVLARRKDRRWWIGGIASSSPVTVSIDLGSFGASEVMVHQDGPDDVPTSSSVAPETRLPLTIPARGGVLIELA